MPARKRTHGLTLAFGLAGLALLLATACAPRVVTVPTRPLVAEPLVYCSDSTGHVKGAAPWILGGTCCCTPTREMFAIYQEEKTVPPELAYEQFLQLFSEKGIKTGLDHRGCNNRCADGPHVVFGGKCMAPPTPGTRNHENVALGKMPEPEPTAGRRK